MNWLQKISNTISGYEDKVIKYLMDVADKEKTRSNELRDYLPDLNRIQRELTEIGYPNPQQAIKTLQQNDYRPIYQIYRDLREISYNIPLEDPRQQIISSIQNNIRNIADQLDEYTFTREDAAETATKVINQTKQNLNQMRQLIESTIQRIEWNGSPVTLIASEPPTIYGFQGPDYSEPVETAEVTIGSQTAWGGTPSFTMFGDFQNNTLNKIEIDDILEGGDTDFFTDPKIQSDYFNLVAELKNPGRSQKELDKVITLYTARPIQDRKIYMNAQTIPPNIFLTNSYQNAVGLAQDYGKRDVWRVRIQQRYIIQTLDDPSVKWYQVKSQDKPVPVKDISLVETGESLSTN